MDKIDLLTKIMPGDETKNKLRSWKYSILAGFLSLVLCSVPFDKFGSQVLPKYDNGIAPALYKMLFITLIYRFISISKWFQSL
jgi:hypothetical protein